MKKFLLLAVVIMLSLPAFSQKNSQDSIPPLGLPGDNLDLYAVLDLFQKSKTIEGFEKSLNDEKTKINNLDLNLDKKIDFIKVVTKQKDESYSFILQVDVTKSETQDVAVILLDRDKNKKVSLQIVGDEELYGKDYVIEPKGNSSITANPGYTGENPVTENVPATTVVVQSAPIVQYVYSPAYVPYYPPYYYGYYPPWFGFATVMAVGIYRSNHYYYHHGYYGGHYSHNTVVINNRNNFNNYNNNKMRSTTVSNNMARGNYGNGSSNRRGSGASATTRPSNTPSNKAGNKAGNNASVSNRQSPSVSNRQSPSTSTRQSPSYTSPSSRSGSGGGGRSMGGGRSGGGMRGGGGGRIR
ncbi:hypothetical protein [Solitalea lacus]|uniref:hypothetical protein n=1 Tax=Solitalea lacus TaxID=2911172 RepID=UPI001EDC21EA|nr:hypothetical protein [Solitalea lacus]UKJ06541.1 hypothetical protein L2B55_13480 [Solitalea lacus]